MASIQHGRRSCRFFYFSKATETPTTKRKEFFSCLVLLSTHGQYGFSSNDFQASAEAMLVVICQSELDELQRTPILGRRIHFCSKSDPSVLTSFIEKSTSLARAP
ncbi:hypothetical protein CDAR_373831 [Caerostris darwini]|uniref:Uncharacterized protein n=1 Tax=Caerostris darwini TaxID=1538125 RepID=A0AAV4QJE1_9ARAC|nr:hypothetical protein CDAR_373831 [Caerostris darwini]